MISVHQAIIIESQATPIAIFDIARISQRAYQNWIAITIEIVGRYRFKEKHVIIEKNKLFGKALYPMDVQFNRICIECRKVCLRYIVLMMDTYEFRVLDIQPLRLLAASDKINLVHPWSKLLDTTEPISQEAEITITGFAVGIIQLSIHNDPFLFILLLFCSPNGVGAINPRNNEIYRIHFQSIMLSLSPL